MADNNPTNNTCDRSDRLRKRQLPSDTDDDNNQRPAKRQKTPSAQPPSTATGTALHPGTETTDIDPDGTILLFFPTARSALRVNPNTMKLSSAVFRIMLGPHFHEGQGLSSATATSPLVIPLPDDDANGMRTICEMLHLQRSTPSDHVEIEVFAALVDKYDMKKAVKLFAENWLKSSMEEARKAKYAHRKKSTGLLFATCMLDSPEAFKLLTRDLILYHRGSYLELRDERGVVPVEALLMMEERRSKARTKLRNTVSRMIQAWSRNRFKLSNRCNKLEMDCLKQFPVSFESVNRGINKQSVSYAYGFFQDSRRRDKLSWGGIYGFDEYYWVLAAHDGVCTQCARNEEFKDYVRLEVDWAVVENFRHIKGVCLDRARNRGQPPPDSECRVPHVNEEKEEDEENEAVW